MSMPEHAIWHELEAYFRTRIDLTERKQIIEVIRHALSQDPQIDLDQLTLEVTSAVLKRRSPAQLRRP
jgi:hypothetical protein